MIKTTFKIISNSIKPSYIRPWDSGKTSISIGSGFATKINNKNYIITNAHVIKSENAYVQVIKWSSSKKYKATIIDISHEVDMALLTIQEKSFWDDIILFPLKTSPFKGAPIIVVGFPKGGSNASITKGIVSRIEPVLYSHTVKNLSLQIDAAVNSGNSGGPVFTEDENSIVGIAFMRTSDAQNMCNMIPSFIMNHYLQSFQKNGNFEGICDLGIKHQKLEGSLLSSYHKKNIEIQGILVRRVDPTINVILKEGDILCAIDDISIQNDGKVFMVNYEIVNELNMNMKDTDADLEKVPYWHIVRMCNPGQRLSLKIYRNNVFKTIKHTLTVGPNSLIPSLPKNISLDYINVNGLIFQPLNYMHLKELEFKNSSEIMSFLLPFTRRYKSSYDEQIIIISEILSNSTDIKYKYLPVLTLNGKSVRSLQHFKELLKGEDVVVLYDNSMIVLETNN